MLAIESEQDTFGEHWELFLKKKKKKEQVLSSTLHDTDLVVMGEAKSIQLLFIGNSTIGDEWEPQRI